MQKFRYICRGEAADGFRSVKSNFEDDWRFDREPVKILEDGSDVIIGGRLDDDTSVRYEGIYWMP